MMRHIIWVTFILTVQLSSVLCRNHYYEHYYSRYHHKSQSTTTALSSSIPDVSTEVKLRPPVSDDDSLESSDRTSTVDAELARHRNKTVHSYEYREVEENMQAGLIIGIICAVVFVVGSCCIFCCVRICCHRNAARRGFIIADRNQGAAPAVDPLLATAGQLPSPMANQYPPQYEEHAQVFTGQYQPQVMQRQYSPVHPSFQSEYTPTAPQGHNPPEAPPPYEFPEKF